MRELARRLRAHAGALVITLLLGVCLSALTLELAERGASVVDEALVGLVRQQRIAWLVVIAVVRVAVGAAQSFVAVRVGHRVATEVRVDLLSRVIAADADSIERDGQTLTTLTQDVTALQTLVAFRLPQVVADGFVAFALVGWCLFQSPVAVIFAGAPLAFAAAVVLPLNTRTSANSRDARRRFGTLVTEMQEHLRGAWILRQANGLDAARRAFEGSASSFEASAGRARLSAAASAAVVQLALVASIAAVAVSLAQQVSLHELTRSGAVGLIASLALAARPLARLTAAWSESIGYHVALERIDFLRSRLGSGALPRGEIETFDREVAFESVDVARGGKTVVRGASFAIRRGDRVAIRGPNGAGKTSIVLVLLGLIRPTSGRVLVDGVETSTGSLCSWVPQVPWVSNLSVEENVTLGAPVNRRDRVLESLAQAGAGEWTSARGGVGSLVDESLSVGERQRICIARALYLRRPILVLDEPAASLDATSREALERTLNALIDGARTVVVVTHDPNIEARCNVLLTVEGGHVTAIRRDA